MLQLCAIIYIQFLGHESYQFLSPRICGNGSSTTCPVALEEPFQEQLIKDLANSLWQSLLGQFFGKLQLFSTDTQLYCTNVNTTKSLSLIMVGLICLLALEEAHNQMASQEETIRELKKQFAATVAARQETVTSRDEKNSRKREELEGRIEQIEKTVKQNVVSERSLREQLQLYMEENTQMQKQLRYCVIMHIDINLKMSNIS